MNLEFLSGNELKKYPFTDDSKLESDTAFIFENDFLLDAQIYRKDATGSIYVKLVSLEIIPATEVLLQLHFFDSNGDELDAPIELTIPAEDVENMKTAVVDHALCCVKLVFGRGIVALLDQTISETFSYLTFSDTAIVQRGPKVNQIHLYNENTLFTTITADDDDIDISFEEGTNISMVDSEETTILDVFAGYGAGLHDACSEELFISTINGIPPSGENNFLFLADNCYTTTPLEHGLLLENHCQPKCTISHFENFVHYLNRIKDGISDVGELAGDTGTELTTQIADYNSSYVPTKNKPYIKHAYIKFPAPGASFYYSVVVGIFNTRDEDIAYDITVTHSGTYVEDTARWKVKDTSLLLASPAKTGTLSCLSVGKLEFVFKAASGTFTISGTLEGVSFTPIVVTVT